MEEGDFFPGWRADGSYTLLDWGIVSPVPSLHQILDKYYQGELQRQDYQQLRHQLLQKVRSQIQKLQQKRDIFLKRLQQSQEADSTWQTANLLMANLHQWQPGMKSIMLEDFESGSPVTIPLQADKNAIENAQVLYKQHRKLKRASGAVEPLLQQVTQEIDYLEQIETLLIDLGDYQSVEELKALWEIQEELREQKYLQAQHYKESSNEGSQPYRYRTPSGLEIWIGRNNRQNDHLSFRTAKDYDLWFHAQEIAGSHVLLRLVPGTVPDEQDLQCSADMAAYYSKGRQSEQVPVVYTRPKYIFKPKGAKPGVVVYQQEKVLWGKPQDAKRYLLESVG